jgi:hypothetical protein
MRTALAALLLVLAPAALAAPAPKLQGDPTPPPAMAPAGSEHATDDCARARAHGKTCVLDMGGENVDGDVAKHSEIDITVVPSGKYGSLINIRRDFLDKIVKTADDL